MKKLTLFIALIVVLNNLTLAQAPVDATTKSGKSNNKPAIKTQVLSQVKKPVLPANGFNNAIFAPSRKYKPKATSAIVFYEDFDEIPGPTAGGAGTYAFPTGWFLRNVDNRTPDAQVAYVNEAWERREDFANNTADSVAFSTSYYSPFGQADDWMWTPQIAIPSNSNLKWNALAYDAAYPDGYEIRIMTTAPTGGNGDIGNQVSASTQVFSIPAENTVWTARTVSLTAYEGQNVYIGFRNNSNDQFVLVIDDILVESDSPIDAELVSITPPSPYTIIPLSQVSAFSFGGTIRNNSPTSINNVGLNVDIKVGQDNAGTFSSPTLISSIAASQEAPIPSFTPFTPKSRGNYELKYYPTLTETDATSDNDTIFSTVSIDSEILARDNGSVTGFLGIGAGVEGVLGTVFTINNTATLKHIEVFFNAGSEEFPTYNTKVRIYGTTPQGIPDNNPPIWESDPILFNETEAALKIFDNPDIVLTPGSYFFSCVEMDNTIQVGQANDIFTANTNFARWATSPFGDVWSPVETFGVEFAKTFVIRPIFKCPTNLTQSASITSGIVDKIATNQITATNQIEGAKVEYNAGKSILLNPGFNATGNRFKAEIGGGCNN